MQGFQVDQIVTISPTSIRQYAVDELDHLYGENIRVTPVDPAEGENPDSRWVSLTHVRPVDEQEDATE